LCGFVRRAPPGGGSAEFRGKTDTARPGDEPRALYAIPRMKKIDVYALTREELEQLLAAEGFPSYRARQLHAWTHRRGVTDTLAMTNLPRGLKEFLAKKADLAPTAIEKERRSKLDPTVKFLLRLRDGLEIETVLMRNRSKATVCVSTQVGCALGCAFCATGAMGLSRNLTTSEIVGQVLTARPAARGDPSQDRLNVVFMGMGEPLANCPALFKAIEILNDPEGPAIGARRMTVSTAGLPAGMRRLAKLGIQVGLAISLNAARDDLRSRIMPINKRYPLRRVIDAAAHYASLRGRRVTIEYVMLGGINDKLKDAKALAEIASELPCKINLIEYNTCPGLPFRPPTREALVRFVEYLYDHAPAVTLRKSKGSDIEAACGQLSTASGARRRRPPAPRGRRE